MATPRGPPPRPQTTADDALCESRGVPLFGTVESGHRSDKTLSAAMIDRLVDALSPDQLRELIYVADSALVTIPNLARLESRGPPICIPVSGDVRGRRGRGRLDSGEPPGHSRGRGHLPGLIGWWSIARVPAIPASSGQWTAPSRPNATPSNGPRGRWRPRLLSVKPLPKRPWTVGRRRRWRGGIACPGRWRAALIRPGADARGRRRPTPTPSPPGSSCRPWGPWTRGDQRAIAQRSALVLITTVSPDRLSAAELLAEYKGQVHVEHHFHFLKDPLFVDALFVKKPERLEALGYVLLGAWLLYRLPERR